MDIPYLKEPKKNFIFICEGAIQENRAELDSGNALQVDLQEDGGYNGSIIFTIRPNDNEFFSTDWESKAPSRFPSRIKAAATALMKCGYLGQFEVSHFNGLLKICKA